MLDLKFIVKNPDTVKENLRKRGEKIDIDEIVMLDGQRREIIQRVESLKKERNEVSKQIGELKRRNEDISEITRKMKKVSNDIAAYDSEMKSVETAIKNKLLRIPNLLSERTPVGADDTENVVDHEWGEKPDFGFEAKPHWEIAEDLNLVDFTRGAKIAQSRFSVYTGMGAKMERALINFMLDEQTSNGYTEVIPPFLVNAETMQGTGQLPKFEDDLFKCERDGLYLIPTAEVPLTNIYASEILMDEELPVKMTAYTPCFRREAGAHGQDTRGLIRQHQFNKVELVKIVEPEDSAKELELLLSDAEGILKKLNLPYRVVKLCSGDVGFSAAFTYDIEVWLPGQECYREISSCSTFTDFQARRAGIRYKSKGEKGTHFPYTLNGSGLAVGRTFLAILENYQQSDGSIVVPEALRPYMNGLGELR
ncbi:Seryl-tRNA synthetase [Flexistipes sinusarabici DSM 4947]|uniref:Serine--tRNA ligase n=1 Tax=Flexistipes sinusarabici (strain ATCC 49648 / DSM 4947 / MAS 10) TaxID=717231 RepID=F8E9P5_FLESM|nr:serine--tRNA ligase [Flexistipes sinusarabici]AEI14228.1 Seryl-tRNA synthetase [Flexistipes sinusarabici DSM 4947]